MAFLSTNSEQSRKVEINTFYHSELASRICIGRASYEGIENMRVVIRKDTKNTSCEMMGDDLILDYHRNCLQFRVYRNGEIVGTLSQPLHMDSKIYMGLDYEFN